jgi:hypothetical protein
VRPADVRAAAQLGGRLVVRAPRLALLGCVATLLAAGCGGASASVEEVPGAPVSLTVPGNADVLAPDVTATPTATASTGTTSTTATGTATPTPTATPTATPTPATGTTGTTGTTGATDDTGTATGETDTGGTAAGSTGSTGTTTGDSPPPPGSNVQKFEEFCAQNPGAC